MPRKNTRKKLKIISRGQTWVKEILSMSPGVWASENSLSIYGKTGTAIYIDDRLINLSGVQLIEYIRSLQADEIARIEVIPNAGAEYAANSPGGVIKIYLKKRNIDGLIGNIGTSATYGKDKVWFNPNGYISIHKSKLTYSLYVSSNMSPRNDILTSEKSSNNVSGNQIFGNIRNGQKTINANIMLGIYYDMNKKSRFGIEVEHIASNKKDNSTSNSLINNKITEEYKSSGTFERHDKHPNTNLRLSYTYLLDSIGSKVRFSANYNRQNILVNENNKTIVAELNDSTYNVSNSDKYDIFSTELLFDKIFSKKCNLSFGGQYTRNNVNFTSEHEYLSNNQWYQNSQYDIFSKYSENITGIYGTVNLIFGRVHFKGGIRGEFYSTDNNIYNSQYFDLFPNANISVESNSKCKIREKH